MFSADGVTYIPSGQCPAWRREAYSREMAVRVRVLREASCTKGRLVLRDGLRDGPRERAFDGLERSIVGEGTRPLNMIFLVQSCKISREGWAKVVVGGW